MLMSKPLLLNAYRGLNTIVWRSKFLIPVQQHVQSSSSFYRSAVLCVRAKNLKENFYSKSDDTETNDGNNQEGADPPKSPFTDPVLMRRIRIYMLMVGGCTFVLSYLALKPLFAQHFSKLDVDLQAKPLEMDEFLKTFIPSGEVKRIVHFPNQGRAVAWLHDGAIINGKPVTHSLVVIKYDRSDGRPAEHFHAEIRAEEMKLGIPLENGVQIQDYYGFTSRNLIELLVGVAILGFLASQYGRLILARMAQQKTKGGS